MWRRGAQLVLSIGKLGVGQENYYLSRVASGIEDYYTGDGETAGQWLGAAAARLGLEGEVTSDQLRAVLAGRHPSTDEQLSGRPNGRRVPGWDLTFSAPKSVSLLHGLGEPAIAGAALRSHEAAITAALDYLDRHAVVTRRSIDGAVHQVDGAGLVIAAFRHRTSRAGDPQLHTHCLAANMVEHPAGWGALHSPVLYRHARTAGFVYQAILRSELTEHLGVSWRPVHNGMAEIDGIDPAVLRAFSKRRVEIEARLDTTGDSTPQAGRAATLDTRKAKEYGVEPETLADRWHTEAAAHGFRPRHLDRILGQRPPVVTEQHLDVAVDEMAGPEGLTQLDATFRRQDVTRAWCTALPAGAHVGIDALEELTEVALEDPRLVRLDSDPQRPTPSEVRWSTTAMLATERRLLSGAQARRHGSAGVVPAASVNDSLDGRKDLSDEQAEMVRHLLTSGQGVDVVVGQAGTGKTYALAAAVELWRQHGFTPLGVALAARAAAELEAGASVPSTTVARMLIDCDQATQAPLTSANVVIVDEAGMVDTRRLERLARHAQAAGAKLVLVGDHHQLPPVEAGGAFAALTRELGAVELTENRRQVERWEQQTLSQLRIGRGGRPGMAVVAATYQAHDRIHVNETADEARAQMVIDWYEARQRGETPSMLALRRSHVRELNLRARGLLVEDGTVSTDGATWAGRTFATGDEIVCLDNDRRLGLHNALLGRVVDVDQEHGLVIEAKTSGRLTEVPSGYLAAGHVDHAYALTIHRAQGMTTGRTLLLADDRLYRQSLYTALSRGRDRNDLYLVHDDLDADDLTEGHGATTTDPAEDRLLRSMARDGSKHLARSTFPSVGRGEADRLDVNRAELEA
jgi:conjugative relaxase-like TrwC/TraI family protein